MTSDPRSLGAVLREARLRKKISLRDAAEGTGLSYSSLARIETGQRVPATLEPLLAVGSRVGVPAATLAELAGGIDPGALADVAGPRTRRALRGGRLSPDALLALRRVHVEQLIEPIRRALSRPPINVNLLAKAADVTIRIAPGYPGFDRDGSFHVPPTDISPLARATGRAWVAHGVAHALLARDAGEPPSCLATAPHLAGETEAGSLAGLLLLPRALLAATLRGRPLPALGSVDELAFAIEEIASEYDVPAGVAATRLAEENALQVLDR